MEKSRIYNFTKGAEGVESSRPYLFSKDSEMKLPSTMQEGKTLTNKFGREELIFSAENHQNTSYYKTIEELGDGLNRIKNYQTNANGELKEINSSFQDKNLQD